MASLAAQNRPIDVQDIYSRFALDAASEFLFGKNVDTLSWQLPLPGTALIGPKGSATADEFGSFAQAFENAQVTVMRRSRRGYFWPAYEILQCDPHEADMKIIQQWVDPLVERVLENKSNMRKAGVQNSLDQSVFLEYLADNTEGQLPGQTTVTSANITAFRPQGDPRPTPQHSFGLKRHRKCYS